MESSLKMEIKLPYDPRVTLVGIYPEEIIIKKDTCTPVFIAALFTIARTCKQPRYSLKDAWIKKLWFIYTIGYYSSVKRNTFDSAIMRWINLEPLVESEASQKE